MILAESPRRQRVTKLVNWGHWFALANIVIALIIASIFIFASPPPGSAFGSFYLVANWFGHIGFLTFFGFVIFILPLCYLDVSQRVIKTIASVIAASGLALLAFDALLFNRTGFHLSHTSADLLRNEAQTEFSQFGWQQWGYLLMLFIVWLGFQLVLANAIFKRVDRLIQFRIARPVLAFFVVCFVSSHAIHVWADANLYQPIIKQDNMFPLSYPATAKTTMSRYGLLDLARYEQRKQLQFDPDVHQVNYPSEPVYCALNQQQDVILLIQTDDAPMTTLAQYDLRRLDNYYTTASSAHGLVTSVMFGVPEMYQDSLQYEQPVLIALSKAYNMPLSIMSDLPITQASLTPYLSDQDTDNSATPGIHIGFLTAKNIDRYLAEDKFSDSIVLVATGFTGSQGTAKGTLYSNLAIRADLATTEDLTPTLLNAMGCKAPVANYSTGQNLLNPTRKWLVSTSGERIVVLHNNQQIDVLSNGSYEIINLDDNSRSHDKLNVDLLSQAIKHLTRFSG